MSRAGAALPFVVVLVASAALALGRPPAAHAINVDGPICTFGGLISGVLGRACEVVIHGRRLISAGGKLIGGHVGQALNAVTGGSAAVHRAVAIVGLAAIAASVAGGAHYALQAVASLISATTEPALGSSWFGTAYWQMAAIALLLTLPLLLVAVAQAILRSDLGLLVRTAFGFLPLSGLAVGLAVPLTVLLLRGSDEMAALVSAGHASALIGVATFGSGLVGLATHDVFLGFLLGLIACAMAVALWIELAIRQAAVTVIVLMLPLFFAAIVWPARRIWAVRAVELLISLILSKFVIVAVLKVGAAALSHSLQPGATSIVTGTSLILLAAFSPWALLRILPLHELAAGAASGLRPGRSAPLGAVAGGAQSAAEFVDGRGEETTDRQPASTGRPVPAADADADATEQLLLSDGSSPPDAIGGRDGGSGTGPSAPGGPEGRGPSDPVGDAIRRVDAWTRRPRPGSDIDPVVSRASDFSWRLIDLDENEVASDEPLLPPEEPEAPTPEPTADPPAPPPDDAPPGATPPPDAA